MFSRIRLNFSNSMSLLLVPTFSLNWRTPSCRSNLPITTLATQSLIKSAAEEKSFLLIGFWLSVYSIWGAKSFITSTSRIPSPYNFLRSTPSISNSGSLSSIKLEELGSIFAFSVGWIEKF